jgi:hypothetical protein
VPEIAKDNADRIPYCRAIRAQRAETGEDQ